MADNRVAYGLAKKYGIDTTGMSPKEVWEALQKKGVKELGGHGKDENVYKSADELKEQQIIKPAPQAIGFNRLKTGNHLAHAKEMGYKNEKEYMKSAIDFFNSNIGKVYYSPSRKRYYKIDENLWKMAVITEDGLIATFMKITPKYLERKKRREELDERKY